MTVVDEKVISDYSINMQGWVFNVIKLKIKKKKEIKNSKYLYILYNVYMI